MRRAGQISGQRKGWQAVLGNVIWVVVVIGFWAMVFSIVALLVYLVASGRDGEQIVCELSSDYWRGNLAPT